VLTIISIQIKRILYTVPSRLIGKRVRVHIYDNRLDVYLGSTHTATLDRAFASDKNHRGRQVNYRHVISSLEKKPQAFRYSNLRDDLLPSDTYKAVWAWLDREMEPRKACKVMVGILALAHRADCESRLGNYLQNMQASHALPSLHELELQFDSKEPTIPNVEVNQPPVASYDALLGMDTQGVH
jgi:hypothetical protein